VNIFVRRDDLSARAIMARLLSRPDAPHSGIVEHVVSDETRNEEGITILADANLKRFANPSVTGQYVTWKPIRAGQKIEITYPERKLWGTFQVKGVHSQYMFAPDWIKRSVQFSDQSYLRFIDVLRAQVRKRKDTR
jgi:hypothetical protein